MAKITIELDTAMGDTLSTALAALMINQVVAPFIAKTPENVDLSKMKPGVFVYGNDSGNPQADIYAKVAAEIYKDPKREEFGTADGVEREAFIAAGKAMVEESFRKPMRNGPLGPEIATSRQAMAAEMLTEYDGERKRGTAGHNGGRRTKAQIESDTLYFTQEMNKRAAAAHESSGVETTRIAGGGYNDWKAEQTAKAAAALAAMEAGVHDDTEDAKQDAKDEAAETAAQPADAAPTLEDLRKAYVRYSDKFGTPAAIRDVRNILGCGVNAVPADKIAEGLAKMQAAMDAPDIDAHLKGLSTPETTEKLPEALPPTATKVDLVQAIAAYAQKYDGLIDPKITPIEKQEIPCTKEDLPKVFAQVFGPGVTGIGSMPGALTNDSSKISPEDWGKIVTAVKAATTNNVFKRAAVKS